MADKEITIVTKNDTVSTNPLSAVFSKFSEGFNNLPLPFKFPLAKKVETERKATVRGGEVTEVKKTTTVTFPDARSKSSSAPAAATPLKLESEDADRQTNPLVYAVGGFFVLKWAWGRWNERRERKKSSNEDPPSSSPTMDEDNYEGATGVLIDAWGERYLELSRGNLKQKHWKEVADIVSSRTDFMKVPKTDIQCKNRIDTVKKKYKLEKAKIAAGGGPSTWKFFDRLEELIGPNVASKTESEQDQDQDQDPDSPESDPYEQKRIRLPVPFSAKQKQQEGEGNGRGSKDKNWGESVKELTKAIVKFAETYEQAESLKLQQMVEMQKQSMKFAKELELQRMQFFMKTQMELSQLKQSIFHRRFRLETLFLEGVKGFGQNTLLDCRYCCRIQTAGETPGLNMEFYYNQRTILVDGQRWRWPQNWLNKYNWLNSILVPTISNTADKTVWIDSKGDEKAFATSTVWADVRGNGSKCYQRCPSPSLLVLVVSASAEKTV
ncbi:hypothetical protein CTI12_AA210430 [Artemisia annua]|uniref:Myb/SANT-like DNA-binding domain-containing protein n=1 Tax=Artemisia annua TaxID=35608 RepID=A0A2U1NZR6_ARTAN|nr:hypothetical protein CTI12_AA210430 [Artemisia annua]